MLREDDAYLTVAIGEQASPLRGERSDHDPLLELIGDARVVLLGEASHGTHEFYRARAEITKRLIMEKGFTGVAVEADWPDAWRVNRFVRGTGEDDEAVDALDGFRRFPQWMWRNADVLDFVGWMRESGAGAGFYGLDLYSLHASMAAVLEYLERVDPEAARRARARYACLEDFGDEPQDHGAGTALGISRTCQDEVVEQLVELQRRRTGDDDFFSAEQNARVVMSAEAYYRALFGDEVSTWNLRDTHMADTLDAVLAQLARRGPARLVVWAHNSHVGDARHTEMAERGELNLGQLARQRHGDATRLVGFTTYAGTVSAASDWGGPVERKRVRRALEGSYEALFHEVALPRFLLDLRHLGEAAGGLVEQRLERAIGVIYKPETERWSHYLACTLPRQFDAVLHFDGTRAVEPLERTAGWEKGELPETFPAGV